jgi:hypothetical protein
MQLVPRKLYWLILIGVIVRIAIAASINLGNDEVYYLLYGRYLSWNYFDHPPMIGWAIWLSTAGFHLQNEIFYRLPGIIGAAISTMLLFKTVSFTSTPKAGWIAAILYQASIYTSIIGGLFVMPDAVQLPFWLAAIYSGLKIVSLETNATSRNKHLLLFSLFAGLAMLAKIHAVFLWVGLMGFVVFQQRQILKNPMLYLGMIITALCMLPVLKWNIDNQFITYTYHESRVTAQNGLHIDYFLRELLGGLIYQNPLVYVVFIAGIINIRKIQVESSNKSLLLWFSLPLIGLLLTIALFRETLPHWSGPAFLPIMMLASIWLSQRTKNDFFQKLPTRALGLVCVLLTAAVLLIQFYPGTIGRTNEPTTLGEQDFTLDLYGWKSEGENIATYLEKKQQNKFPLVCKDWFPAGHIDEYIARKAHTYMVGIGSITDIHQYYWINNQHTNTKSLDTVLFINPTNYPRDAKEQFHVLYSSIQLDTVFTQLRMGKPARNFYIYKMGK